METKKIMWMIKKDLLELWRHKPRLIAILLFPIIAIVFFGYGMGGSLENIPIVIVEQSHGPVTDQTVAAIKNMSLYDVKEVTSDPDQAKDMVESGAVKAAIILPPDYDNLKSRQAPTVILYVDSSDQLATQAIVPATQTLFARISGEIGVQKMQIEGQTGPITQNGTSNMFQSIVNTINFEVDRIYGDVKYMDFLIPGILAMTIMFACMGGMGRSIAGERETGELARLFMTPTSIATVVGGKIMSKLITETGRALILLIVAIVLFGVTIKGSILLTVLLLVLTALCFVGFGIMISARAETQEDYMQMMMPFQMPMMFVSGVFYPIETMPWFFQKLAYVFPLTYANDALRAVILKGAGITEIWSDIMILLAFTFIFFTLGVTRFNRDI
ncbi:MAG TPA: ABC transporter permease [Methanothermobacter sp.]|uniref:ABC transporter permease n=1 Tax=Methanothermobacter tenebrarum TaxID=680118 RepID=A0ABN6PD08_9EURY|nr:ABC transporter permease [Methanothermobacter tenebrarum]MDI6882576.1 ABC transporter permease [Methanothermobacter sp.]BDH78676.1 ABC transporter permease [Methanothermobacter tenebrarum]HHW16352.1 ABC transporter permease [Methanothermobacter sp.]HOQ19838.1 ABC transporter permease [Methanothermobacter sp.]